MPAEFRHFAINANDVLRAQGFYEKLFGWSFQPSGPPNFFQIEGAGAGVIGALQGRREIAGPGVEVTMGVADIQATVAAVDANGGRVIMPPFGIPGVGKLIFFEDTEGNHLGAMQYEAARPA